MLQLARRRADFDDQPSGHIPQSFRRTSVRSAIEAQKSIGVAPSLSDRVTGMRRHNGLTPSEPF